MGSHIRLLNHRLGDLVDVAPQRKYGMPDSESGKGYVVGCNVDNISYDVQYIGNISYPKIAGNESRIAGREYFHPLEVTGATKTTKNGTSKYSLMHDWWPRQIDHLERLSRQLIQQYGVDIVIRYQWDGAGPHVKDELLQYIDKEFQERGWLFIKQPSQLPLTNINDCCIFPAMSKRVSAEQGVLNGSRIMANEELWELVQRVYNNMPLDIIARSFAHHVQMVNAIHQCGGGDQYHKDGGLHCGVRKAFAPVYVQNDDGEISGEPIGVECIEAGVDLAEQTTQMKYPKPNVDNKTDRWSEYLTAEELDLLVENLPFESVEWQHACTATLQQQWSE